MVKQVAEQLYTIPIPLPDNPLKSLNVYVITGERNLLVDTGFRQQACREALQSGLRELGISMDQTDIFLTHLHSDHTGLAPEIASGSTRIYIGARDRCHMPGSGSSFSWAASDRRYAQEGFPEKLLKILTTQNPAQGFAPEPYDGYLPVQDGDLFCYGGYTFRAISTPGHTPGHMILWEAQHGIALLGDHVLFDITPNISRWADCPDALGAYLESLKKIRELPVTLPLPAHRSAEGNVRSRCDQLLKHHQQRCEEVLRILSDGEEKTAWEIAAEMTWRIRAKCWDDFPPAQKWFAVGEAMAHLDHLIQLQLVRKQEKEASPDGLIRYAGLKIIR